MLLASSVVPVPRCWGLPACLKMGRVSQYGISKVTVAMGEVVACWKNGLVPIGVIALSSPTGAWAMAATAMLFLVACSTCALFSGGSLPTVLMSPLLYGLLYVAYGIGFVCGLIESPALQHNARS